MHLTDSVSIEDANCDIKLDLCLLKLKVALANRGASTEDIFATLKLIFR